jgi:hypothetical protein
MNFETVWLKGNIILKKVNGNLNVIQFAIFAEE